MLPSLLDRPSAKARKLVKNLSMVGIGISASVGLFSAFILKASAQLFTTDAQVQSILRGTTMVPALQSLASNKGCRKCFQEGQQIKQKVIVTAINVHGPNERLDAVYVSWGSFGEWKDLYTNAFFLSRWTAAPEVEGGAVTRSRFRAATDLKSKAGLGLT
eukprot:symbB.v1.2.002298.t1/scaffold107.1/size327550/14